MRLKSVLKLRKIGNRFMIVDVYADNVNLTNVYTLNATAARLWEIASRGEFTPQSLADSLVEEYDVEPDRALADVTALIADWERYSLVSL